MPPNLQELQEIFVDYARYFRYNNHVCVALSLIITEILLSPGLLNHFMDECAYMCTQICVYTNVNGDIKGNESRHGKPHTLPKG